MPNAKFHAPTSTAAGAIVALLASEGLPAAERVVEAIGGALGGRLGGMLPDMIDVPDSPNHRSIGHGIGSSGAFWTWAAANAVKAQEWLRDEAARQAELVAATQDGSRRAWHTLLQVVCLLLAGLIVGLPAGYLTHLGFDATTKRGLPVFA